MKKAKQTIRYTVLAVGTVALFTLFVVTAWAATISIVEPYNASNSADIVKTVDSTVETGQTPKARAPEPSTIILFGSGLFGMIVSFVRKTYHATKRLLDIIAGILGLVVLSPLFLVTAILIKLTSKGPVFYKQIRVGKSGKAFWIYKFRTMHVDAEKETGPVWATENDERYIPCAKFLRKSHIDEIPQFVNILNGDMSLIGPRPERPVFVDKFKDEIENYEKRLEVKPGLTGLAQVWHRYDETIEDVKKKIKYELGIVSIRCSTIKSFSSPIILLTLVKLVTLFTHFKFSNLSVKNSINSRFSLVNISLSEKATITISSLPNSSFHS